MKKEEYHKEGIRLIEKEYNDNYTNEDCAAITIRGTEAFTSILKSNTYGRRYTTHWFAMFVMGVFHGAYLNCEDEEEEEVLRLAFKAAKIMKKDAVLIKGTETE
jgi:hypothetical protein